MRLLNPKLPKIYRSLPGPFRPFRPLGATPRAQFLNSLSLLGFAFGLYMLGYLVINAQGGRAYDSYAYWLAGRHLLNGEPLYGLANVDTLGAWKYPPLFAQLLAPFSLLPGLVFDWAARLIGVLCLRALAGSWRNLGIWLLFPAVLTEISLANVTFEVALLSLWALRGRARWLAPAIALKFGPALLIPFILLRRRADVRPLIEGLVLFGGLCALSILAAPDLWQQYLATVAPQANGGLVGAGIIALAPTGLPDLSLRTGIAILVIVAAICLDEERLAWVAAVVTVPILAVSRLAPLLTLFVWRPRSVQNGPDQSGPALTTIGSAPATSAESVAPLKPAETASAG